MEIREKKFEAKLKQPGYLFEKIDSSDVPFEIRENVPAIEHAALDKAVSKVVHAAEDVTYAIETNPTRHVGGEGFTFTVYFADLMKDKFAGHTDLTYDMTPHVDGGLRPIGVASILDTATSDDFLRQGRLERSLAIVNEFCRQRFGGTLYSGDTTRSPESRALWTKLISLGVAERTENSGINEFRLKAAL